jgi:hypothetical protein
VAQLGQQQQQQPADQAVPQPIQQVGQQAPKQSGQQPDATQNNQQPEQAAQQPPADGQQNLQQDAKQQVGHLQTEQPPQQSAAGQTEQTDSQQPQASASQIGQPPGLGDGPKKPGDGQVKTHGTAGAAEAAREAGPMTKECRTEWVCSLRQKQLYYKVQHGSWGW